MAHDVFISYATEDMRTVTSLVHFLEADGVRCWYAPRDVLPGANYGAQIADAIRSTRILILVLSSHSNQSTPVSNEVERAVHNGVVVIPIRIEDVVPSPNLELHIAGSHWLDALSETLESHQSALVRAVRKHLEAIGGEPARPPNSTRSQIPPSPHSARAASSPRADAPAHSKPTNRTLLLVPIVSAMLIGAGAGVWFITRPTPPENSLAAGTVPESGTGIPTVAPAPQPPGAELESEVPTWTLVAGERAEGAVGSNTSDSQDDWTYTASANGNVQFEFINRNPPDAELGVIEMVEISSSGGSFWKRPLGPNRTLSSNNIAVVVGQVVRVRVKARDGHAAPYSILLNFAPW